MWLRGAEKLARAPPRALEQLHARCSASGVHWLGLEDVHISLVVCMLHPHQRVNVCPSPQTSIQLLHSSCVHGMNTHVSCIRSQKPLDGCA